MYAQYCISHPTLSALVYVFVLLLAYIVTVWTVQTASS